MWNLGRAGNAKKRWRSLIEGGLVVRISVKSFSASSASGILALVCVAVCTTAAAHVMQQLSWFQVERDVAISPKQMRVHHSCKFDKNMFRADDPILDVDGDSTASRHEIAQFCQSSSNYVAQDFTVLADGLPCATRQESFAVNDDDSGFTSDIVVDMPDVPTTGPLTIDIVDPAYMFTFPADSQSTSTPVTSESPVTLLDFEGKSVGRLDVARSPHVTFRLSHSAAEPSKPAGTKP